MHLTCVPTACHPAPAAVLPPGLAGSAAFGPLHVSRHGWRLSPGRAQPRPAPPPGERTPRARTAICSTSERLRARTRPPYVFGLFFVCHRATAGLSAPPPLRGSPCPRPRARAAPGWGETPQPLRNEEQGQAGARGSGKRRREAHREPLTPPPQRAPDRYHKPFNSHGPARWPAPPTGASRPHRRPRSASAPPLPACPRPFPAGSGRVPAPPRRAPPRRRPPSP